ncbi:hypothetical protein L226DRAFT_534044 [Lentinus tigrinus ALCF2SS1-7]|uniref:Uncharacterized protein n=1 Tax=Lentinus tigrinus ALCF2SS1-6 TaxID=1328759 RepID=A0A5C2SDJ2_9APHY|nr:hypothetical protein L227DRAFT_574256 [Lentinus tigrinus ALCF2SS1-6]RPD75980.1 hypothetical protein L226DRAFT_534044 [Lentinus tigrinus ALCF2SS1-7]
MFPASRTLESLTHVLFPRRGTPSSPHGQRASSAPVTGISVLRTHGARSPPTLSTINLDILRLICEELRRDGTIALGALACCSRTLQQVAAPYIFRSYLSYAKADPPEHIRQYIRHIIIWETLIGAEAAVWIEHLLDILPSLREITVEESFGVAWNVLEIILARPRIMSVTFSVSANFRSVEAYPSDDLPSHAVHLTSLVYTPKMWREMAVSKPRMGVRPVDLNAVFAHEAKCLAGLVPKLRNTVIRLTLPFETAPLRLMAACNWPRLQELSLFGRYLNDDQAESLPVLLSSLMELRRLSIRVARHASLDRPFILGHRSASSTALSGLRSLTVAYPHPDDDLFSIDASHLQHLSLRDWPRYYAHLGFMDRNSPSWAHPLLSAAECLSVLQRMDLPQLTSLELAYLAFSAGSDDDLLDYVANSFPKLTTLELHRYRENREEHVDHRPIVERLAAAKSIRWLRLNLDFHEDHGPYCNVWKLRDKWFTRLTGELGWEIVEMLEEHCPLLESVKLLCHCVPASTWAEFRCCRRADPRFLLDPDDPKRDKDIEDIPHRWYRGRYPPPLPTVMPPPRCTRFDSNP